MSSNLESPIIQSVRSPSYPALPRHYCFQLLLGGEHILKNNLNKNYHKQLVEEEGGGGAQTVNCGMKTQYILATVRTYTFGKDKLIDNARKKLFRH